MVAKLKQFGVLLLQAVWKRAPLEKTPSNAMRPDFVAEVFPEAKFIYIHRDPVECILSIRDLWLRKAHGLKNIDRANYMRRIQELKLSQVPYYSLEFVKRCMPSSFRSGQPMNLWGPRFPGMKFMLAEVGLLPVCCMQWRFCVELCEHLIKRNSASVYGIRLEELDLSKLNEIFDYCDLSETDEVVDAFQERFVFNMASGRRVNASDEELLTIQKWIGPHFQ